MDGHVASHSHRYHHRHFPRFGKVGWNPTQCKCANMPLRFDWGCRTFQTASHIHVIQWYIYERFEHLLRSQMGIWLQTHTITSTDTFPDLGKFTEIQPDASVQTVPLHFGWSCRTFQTASHDHVIHIWGVWASSQVVDGHMASQSHRYHQRHFPMVCEIWLKFYLMQVHKPCHYALVEAVEPFKLHPMSMPYIYEVFEHLLRLRMCIWLHTHIVTTTDASPDLWELAEILPDLYWDHQMSACQNRGQNNWRVFVGPTCCWHVGQHVGNTTQKTVGKGTTSVRLTCHLLTFWHCVSRMSDVGMPKQGSKR